MDERVKSVLKGRGIVWYIKRVNNESTEPVVTGVGTVGYKLSLEKRVNVTAFRDNASTRSVVSGMTGIRQDSGKDGSC